MSDFQNARDGKERKPWLAPEQQVSHLKSKGVKFQLLSEDEAVAYLSKSNNYFRLRSYRTGFPKVDEGPRKGQYANLDFKMLVDLSTADMLLRNELLPMTLDIEHFAKVRLLGKIERAGEDGYEIVADFLAAYDKRDSQGGVVNRAKDEIRKGKSSPYVAGLLSKYPCFDFPVWVFLELVAFGTFIYFYKFCAERFNDKGMLDEFYLLQSVKCLRNACAHNNCILNDMSSGKPMFKARNAVSVAIGEIESVGRGQRRSKLSNDRLQQVATALYVHKRIASKGVHDSRALSLGRFSRRMVEHVDYYRGNDQITSGFDFLAKLISSWFDVSEVVIENDT